MRKVLIFAFSFLLMNCSKDENKGEDTVKGVNFTFTDLQGDWKVVESFKSTDINGKIDVEYYYATDECEKERIVRYDFDQEGVFNEYIVFEDLQCVSGVNRFEDGILKKARVEINDGINSGTYTIWDYFLDSSKTYTVLKVDDKTLKIRGQKRENPNTPYEYVLYGFQEYTKVR